MRGLVGRGLVVAALVAGATPLLAQSAVPAGTATPPARALSLEEALRMAESQSEQVMVAQAGVLRARGQQVQAQSERLPQIGGSLSYTRTLASEFQRAGGGGASDTLPPPRVCTPFTPNSGLSLAERVDSLERVLECTTHANPLAALSGLFRDLPFGRKNQYRFGLSVSQNLFAGGRIAAQGRIARSGVAAAQVALAQARAQLALDVTQAYYDALLSERLVSISRATLEQAENTLRQVRLGRQVGNQPEFELLRAQVARDNQQPLVIQRQSERELALLRLKQLLNLPAGQPIELTSDLGDAELDPAARAVARSAGMERSVGAIDTAAIRSVVQAAEEAVRLQEGMLDIAESLRLPSLVVSSQYGRVAYPDDLIPTSLDDFRTNWTVGVSLSVPIFTGGRVRGEQMVAQANLMEARARLQQVRELAVLDTRSAYEHLEAALAAYQASQGTVEQAARAHQIAEVRYREGISTQVELSDSRILMEQARANRALAARNLQLARMRIALLPHLPLGAGGTGATGAMQGQGGAQQQPQQLPRQAPRQQAASTSSTGIPGFGGQ